MLLFLITFGAFGFVVLIMAVGVIFKGHCIRGSCGGEDIIDANGDLLNCDTCPARKERERRMRAVVERLAANSGSAGETNA
ncbi:MAG: hypothetical protein QGG73_01865 [Candidatus Hydrogenedentes bacterium]|jgi:hypothetical protein|nr:hypothetical protein [Candidatus Hydrogenedentota bacterium]